jgi:CelD/BcsL family acetyltransferase involved in cellulose biosynthesis
MDAWVVTFGPVLDPTLLLFSAGEQAVGVCALVFRQQSRGPFTINQVFLNTAGEARADDLCLEYNNLLVLPGWEQAVARALTDFLKERAWDEIVGNGFQPGQPLDALLLQLGEMNQTIDTRPSNYVSLDELRANGTCYEDAIARGMRKQIRHNRKLYEEEGEIAVEVAQDAGEARLFFRELIDLHQASWKARGAPGVFASERFTGFHTRLIEENIGRGSILLARVRTPKRTIGVLYNFVHDRKIYFYQSGLAYEQDHRIKPGFLSLAMLIQHTADLGYSEFDFLAGDSHYKKLLSTHVRPLQWIALERKTLKTFAIAAMRRYRQNLRKHLAAADEKPAEAARPIEVKVYPHTAWAEAKPIWKQLARKSPYISVFLTVEWVESWLEAFGKELKAEVVCFLANGSPAGICVLTYRNIAGGIIRCIYLNTAGQHPSEETAIEYNNILCVKGREMEIAEALRNHVTSKGCDMFLAPGMVPGPVAEALQSRFQDMETQADSRAVYFVDLAAMRDAGQTFEQILSRKTRQQLCQSMKLYGELELQAARSETEALEIFAEMIALHQHSWIERGHSGAFSSPRLLAFHRGLISRAFRAGTIQLLRLRAGGETIGIRYNFAFQNRIYCYQSGLKYSPDRHLKPGYVLHAAAATYNSGKGFGEYDLMAGGGHYKLLLTNASRELLWLTFRRRGWKTRTADLVRWLKKRIRPVVARTSS